MGGAWRGKEKEEEGREQETGSHGRGQQRPRASVSPEKDTSSYPLLKHLCSITLSSYMEKHQPPHILLGAWVGEAEATATG